jgi:pimeloyl-ACP methyl ester carboxylesterase
MGEVYRARDPRLDRFVALKVLPATLASDPDRVQRFAREAKVLASLNHPNIAQIYGIEESSQGSTLVMELVPGGPIRGPLPTETAIRYAKQIASALEAAHEKGVAHRDLKPANIFVTPAGVIKVLDFGLAAVIAANSNVNDETRTAVTPLTQAGMIIGTPAYMSPEQARGKPADQRTDIWAFGVLLYELLTGQRMFAGETIPDLIAAVLTHEPTLAALPSDVPAGVRSVLKQCLERDLERRPSDIGEVIRQMERPHGAVITLPVPVTKYARSGDVHIAYQVVGAAAPDFILVPGWVSHIEYAWQEPSYSNFLRRLSSFTRLILLDRRGTGLSDRVAELPTLEQRMDDVRAVMDAAGSERAVLCGISEGGPMCMLFAATYPARTSALVLYGTYARMLRAADYPIGLPVEGMETFLKRVEDTWGTGSLSAHHLAPSLAHDVAFRQSWARFERLAVSPGGMRALMLMLYETDARPVLPSIRVPTLIVQREGDLVSRVQGARYIAERIQGAKYVELPGNDHFPWVGNSDAVLDAIEGFLAGERHQPEPDRILSTVMFTNIAGATEKAATPGDQRRDLRVQHHALVRQQLTQFRGCEVDSSGDGFLATFDGPARGIRCASSVIREASRLGLQLRAGLHTGECEVVGVKVSGIAVDTGACIACLAGPGEVLVSSTVKDLVAGSGIAFKDRGVEILETGECHLYAVASA